MFRLSALSLSLSLLKPSLRCMQYSLAGGSSPNLFASGYTDTNYTAYYIEVLELGVDGKKVFATNKGNFFLERCPCDGRYL